MGRHDPRNPMQLFLRDDILVDKVAFFKGHAGQGRRAFFLFPALAAQLYFFHFFLFFSEKSFSVSNPKKKKIQMCGIIGAVGVDNLAQVLIQGLVKMEYRGYDSAGLCYKTKGKLELVKAQGPVEKLKLKLASREKLDGNIGIAHTRWATHGEPSEQNAHPHLSQKRIVAVVHNGIIENKHELETTVLKGYTFTSQTDTEVIPHLIEHEWQKDHDELKSFQRAIGQLQGAFAIVCMFASSLDTLYAFCKESPLCFAVSEKDEIFIASEASAFPDHVIRKVDLEDNEIAVARDKSVRVYSLHELSGKDMSQRANDIVRHREENAGSDERFSHFMIKEIFEQPRAIQSTCSRFQPLELMLPQLTILACGTSLHAGMVGKHAIEERLSISVRCEYASEFLHQPFLLHRERDAVLAISQSGETADTREALKKVLAHNIEASALVNVPGSQIARLVSSPMYLHAGPEISVASTKAFTCQVVSMLLLARVPQEEIMVASEAMTMLLNSAAWISNIKKLASFIFTGKEHALYLGRGWDYPVALEGALKMKEVSYIHAEAYPAGEMKHGPIALICKDFPVVVLVGQDEREKIMSNMEEVKARGARVLCITDQEDGNEQFQIQVPFISKSVSPLFKVLPLQILAYFVAVQRNINPDRPRNLAKSVTVQ
jgi:glucosamine--fructose-6-phosphate aminotransferase (isomerizing)